jgi:hypothetical protein
MRCRHRPRLPARAGRGRGVDDVRLPDVDPADLRDAWADIVGARA